MPETPLTPTPVKDVLLGLGEAFSKRGARGFFAACALLLGGVIAVVYFTAFPNSVHHGLPRPAALDQRAVAVADTFTKLGWNEHNCRAARRYSVAANTCPSKLLPAGSYTFVLNTWRIRRNCLSPHASYQGHRISPGCIQYTTANGETIAYTMVKLPQGWRIVAAETHHGAPYG